MAPNVKKIVSREVLTYIAVLIAMFFIDLTKIWVVGSFGGLLLAALVLYVPVTIVLWMIRRSRVK